jgi:hypothetical protein
VVVVRVDNHRCLHIVNVAIRCADPKLAPSFSCPSVPTTLCWMHIIRLVFVVIFAAFKADPVGSRRRPRIGRDGISIITSMGL